MMANRNGGLRPPALLSAQFFVAFSVLLFSFGEVNARERVGLHLGLYTGISPTFGQKSGKAGTTQMNQTKAVPTSVWGANGIRLTIGDTKVTVEYACADGEITGRLRIDGRGNFRVDGVHARVRPGPVREGASPESHPARFEGRISGKSMTLKVTLIETKEVVGNFELTRDSTPRLHRCL
jgi:hypothetical protein